MFAAHQVIQPELPLNLVTTGPDVELRDVQVPSAQGDVAENAGIVAPDDRKKVGRHHGRGVVAVVEAAAEPENDVGRGLVGDGHVEDDGGVGVGVPGGPVVEGPDCSKTWIGIEKMAPRVGLPSLPVAAWF